LVAVAVHVFVVDFDTALFKASPPASKAHVGNEQRRELGLGNVGRRERFGTG
jgi:hypothetical protein